MAVGWHTVPVSGEGGGGGYRGLQVAVAGWHTLPVSEGVGE